MTQPLVHYPTPVHDEQIRRNYADPTSIPSALTTSRCVTASGYSRKLPLTQLANIP